MKKLLIVAIFIFSLVDSTLGQGFKILSKPSTITEHDVIQNISFRGENEQVHKTKDIILYDYLAQKKAPEKQQLSDLLADLFANANGPIANRYTDIVIKTKTDQIAALQTEIADMEKQQDSLYFQYTKDYISFRKTNFCNFGPIRSKAFFDYVYGNSNKQFKTLNNSGFNLGNSTGSVFSELVSGYLGIARVSLGAMVTKSSSSDSTQAKEEEAYQRLITYGGNTVLTFEYPLVYLHTKNNLCNFITRFLAKGTADLPAFGTTTDKWAGSGSLGLDFYGDASLTNSSLKFFFNFNVSRIYGTDEFRNNLQIGNNNFNFGQLSCGLVILNNLKISFVISTFSSESNLSTRRVVAGGSVLN